MCQTVAEKLALATKETLVRFLKGVANSLASSEIFEIDALSFNFNLHNAHR